MALHIIQSSSTQTGALANCLAYCSPQDTIVLINDGVYEAQTITKLELASKTYALEIDAITRGIPQQGRVLWIDYKQFVDLTAIHAPVVNWG